MKQHADRNSVQRDIEGFQHQLDKLFKRANEAPVYDTRKKLEDAVSDNPRYYPPDRRKELAEILFGILDVVYERAGDKDDAEPFCNPFLPGADLSRLPESEMLLRCMMPLAWAIRAQWVFPEMKRVTDDYIASFSQPQAHLVWQVLDFLLELFPDKSENKPSADVLAYWRELAEAPERFHLETESEKSHMLPILLEAAQKHNIIPKDGE